MPQQPLTTSTISRTGCFDGVSEIPSTQPWSQRPLHSSIDDETSAGFEGYHIKVTGGPVEMALSTSTSLYEETPQEKICRIACLLSIQYLPPQALPELLESIVQMFEFYSENGANKAPRLTQPVRIKPKISPKIVHPTFSLDDE